MTIRQPIVTVAGHVDHGKTTILDSIRKTNVYDTEAGGITQKISFTKVPIEHIKKSCPLIEKQGIKIDIPGFLFIDTPGHAAFSHLRKRGGSLADIAILLIDINDGIKPQTQEVISILKLNKIPFIVALNKIDNISSWRKQSDNLKDNLDKQSANTKTQFQEKLLTLIGTLHHHGFNAKPFYEVTDFTKELALIPCSAKTGEGIQELILTLAGISEKFLKKNLKLGNEAKGVILEIKKEKDMQYAESILYDGELKSTDEIAIASFEDPIITKIRVLEEIQPISGKFKPNKVVTASTGIRMQLINSENILPGMPYKIYNENLQEIKNEFKKEIGDKLETNEKGIIIKADSLGSLEALMTLLKQERIDVIKAGIGQINKKDLISAETNLKEDPTNAVIVGFNVEEDEEVRELNKVSKVEILKNEIIYKIIEELKKFKEEKENEVRRGKLISLATISKLKILHQYVFRNSNPAVFGVQVEGGKAKPGTPLMDDNGKKIAKLKDVQENNKKVEQAEKGKEIAISLPGLMFDRVLANTEYLYSDLTENQFKKFKDNKDLLTQDEIQTLQKIAEIKRREKVTWGV
jgi:translation initiation factor 5B